MLGRPFGAPHDVPFQHRVLRAALELLAADSGPVLADFPDDAPVSETHAPAVACPVSFARGKEESGIGNLFIREIEYLRPWYDLACERRGRSSVGLSGVDINEAARLLASALDGTSIPKFDHFSTGETIKLLIEDVRTYYHEAAAARPGTPNAVAIGNWFWNATAAGRCFLALHRTFSASNDKSLRQLCATSLVPKAVLMKLP
jgi:hypothetical protein